MTIPSSQVLIPENKRILYSKMLNDDDTSIGAVMQIVRDLLAPPINGFYAWEPETIWLELDDLGCDISELNRSKLLCCIAMAIGPDVIYSNQTFKNIILNINNIPSNNEIEEDVSVEQIAWAIAFIEYFFKGKKTILFDYEPIKFTARMLHEEGMFLAPSPLKFAQSELSKLNNNNEYEKEVERALYSDDDKDYNDIVKEQLVKHNRINVYVSHMFNAELNDEADIRALG
jgi:hypothetical protein